MLTLSNILPLCIFGNTVINYAYKESRIKIILQVRFNSNKNTQISQLGYLCNNHINDWVIFGKFAIRMTLEASLGIPYPSIPHFGASSISFSSCLPSERDSAYI